ncbi:MAG: hypothetical protein WDZ49_10155 [Litorilinea sp.]
MFLPHGHHHVLLNRDRLQTLRSDSDTAGQGLSVARLGPGLLQRLRRILGNGLIRIGRWVRGPVGPLHSRPVVSPW